MWLKYAQLNSSVSGNPLRKVSAHDLCKTMADVLVFNEPNGILATMWESSSKIFNFLSDEAR